MHHRTSVLTATALGLGLAVLAPVAANADTAGHPAASPDVSASMTMWDSSTWYGSGQFVVTNASDAPSDWSLSFRVPSGTFTNHSDWNVKAAVSGDRVTLTPKGGKLAAGQSEYVSFGIEGDGTGALLPEGCSLDGAPVTGCSADDGAGEQTPSAPTDVRMTRTQSHDAIVQWKHVAQEGVTGWTVTLRDAAGTEIRSEHVDGGTIASHALRGLDEGTEYQVSVRARNAQGDGAESQRIRFTTTVNQAPTAPSDLRITSTESERAILQWEHASDDEYVLGYMITLRDESGTLLRAYPSAGKYVSKILTGLRPGTTYQVSMHAYDTAVDGAESETISFTTAS